MKTQYQQRPDRTGVRHRSTTSTRCVISIGGDRGVEATSGQSVKLTLSDPHGDTVSIITLPADQNQTVNGIDAYATLDEYGQAETGRQAITTGGLSYGWLGAKQRATDTIGLWSCLHCRLRHAGPLARSGGKRSRNGRR